VRDDENTADGGGCSTAPAANDPLRSIGGSFALMLGLAAWLRRKRR
jgi:MYXO-CTERM domain-containing protein